LLQLIGRYGVAMAPGTTASNRLAKIKHKGIDYGSQFAAVYPDHSLLVALFEVFKVTQIDQKGALPDPGA
jgi:hypothetical protein